MTSELDLTHSENKPKSIQDFIYEKRDQGGGMVMALIIPTQLIEMMYNVKVNMCIPEEFYLYGWYNVYHFEIYVDTALPSDTMYLVCNTKATKIKVKNG